jgi:glycosyltransferase involved in cell wall biosynthesis
VHIALAPISSDWLRYYSDFTKPRANELMSSELAMSPPNAQRKLIISSRCSQTIYTQRIHLARMARDNGWQVVVAGDSSPGDFPALLRAEGFKFFEIPVNQKSLNPVSLFRLTRQYFRLFRQEKPAVFHAFTIKPFIAGLLAARLSKVPVRIATVPGLGHVFLSSSALVRVLSIMLLRVAASCAHRVFFYNEADRDEYVRRGIVRMRKTAMIAGSGIDTARFPVAPWPAASEVFSVVYIGRMLREKGISELLEAAKRLHQANALVKITLVGDIDPNNPSSLSRDEIDAAVQSKIIEWYGFTTDIRPHIAKAHAVILPSHREGIPLALLEGGAMGRALIATDVPGCREAIINGVTGLLTPLGDVEALVNAIAAFIKNPETARTMGQAAHRYIVQQFDTKIVNSNIISDYALFDHNRKESIELI